MTHNEELRKAICLTAVLSQAVGAAQGAECAASVVGLLLLPDDLPDDATTFDIVNAVIQHRVTDPRTYGGLWTGFGVLLGERLARRAAEAWDTGMVSV